MIIFFSFVSKTIKNFINIVHIIFKNYLHLRTYAKFYTNYYIDDLKRI